MHCTNAGCTVDVPRCGVRVCKQWNSIMCVPYATSFRLAKHKCVFADEMRIDLGSSGPRVLFIDSIDPWQWFLIT
jgi:hypothetical protein